MTAEMPRGAIPVPRSALAASEPYRADIDAGVFVPSGEFPSSNQDIAAAPPYRARGTAPSSFLAWPTVTSSWESDGAGASLWAEEAFAKACAHPRVFIPPEVVQNAARTCGSSNFAAFMQSRGFRLNRKAYLNGPFHSVDWTNEATLHGAIAEAGPVKIGLTAEKLIDHVVRGRSGWAICHLANAQPKNHCASLCGYGSSAALIELFARHRVAVDMPSDMPAGTAYAMFFCNSIGIIDRRSLLNITGEAWVRNPTTIVRET